MTIEPHYLGSIEYFVLLKQYDTVCFEVCDKFRKQTYRNRTYLLLNNRVQLLSIPLHYSHNMCTKDVKIDYSQRWIKDHYGTLKAGYGKAPFFEFFEEYFLAIWNEKHPFLIDLNLKLIDRVLQLIQVNLVAAQTENHQRIYANDFRNVISPKADFNKRNIYYPHAYHQSCGNHFFPNLSMLDLIMNMGPKVEVILKKSTQSFEN